GGTPTLCGGVVTVQSIRRSQERGMKIRELKDGYGGPAWPPKWPSWPGAGRVAAREDGVLKDVRRNGNRLSLTMKDDAGLEHAAVLGWTPPPSVDAVEKVLKDGRGQPIKAIGELDV